MFGNKSVNVLTLIALVFAYCYSQLYLTKKLSPIVETDYGKLRGSESTSRSGKAFYEFLGIPFARPPVGERRFEVSEPPEKWEGIREATSHGNKCIQMEFVSGILFGDEDCLYLNVFTPKKKHDNGTGFPVMIFIHGGAFATGSASDFGAKYFLDNDIILVVINYRLAALGFLNTGDGLIRGNMGLKDQVMAFKWVQNNIENFGGNPRQVTIFGESAGAISASLHILSPLTKGLFHKAIIQSGTAVSHWAISKNPKIKAENYASRFCPTKDPKEMVACLKKIDAATFFKGYVELKLPIDMSLLFGPTIELIKDRNAFLTEDPMDILESGRFPKIPLISGVNSEEGLLIAAVFTNNQTSLNRADSEWTSFASECFTIDRLNEEIALKIRNFYFPGKERIASKEFLANYTNMISDRSFFWPVHTMALMYSKYAPIRLYYYTHQGEISLAPIFAATQGPFPFPVINVVLDLFLRWFKSYFFNIVTPHMGASHVDELPIFFNIIPLPNRMGINHPDHKDYSLSTEVVKLWTAFAFATEDNSEPLRFKDVEWPVVSMHQYPLKYLRIDDDAAVIDEPFAERVKFWESLNINVAK